jgi:tetratricopeptide (TPR) repeat protein
LRAGNTNFIAFTLTGLSRWVDQGRCRKTVDDLTRRSESTPLNGCQTGKGLDTMDNGDDAFKNETEISSDGRREEEQHLHVEWLQPGGLDGSSEGTEPIFDLNQNSDAYFRRAARRREAGDAEGAIRDLTRSLDVHPEDRDALMHRAELWGETGRWVRAEADLDDAIGFDPRHAALYARRSAVRLERGDSTGAVLDSAISLVLTEHEPARGEASQLFQALVRTHAGTGMSDREVGRRVFCEVFHDLVCHGMYMWALETLEECRTPLNLNEGLLRLLQGVVLFQAGDYESAAPAFEEAVNLDPECADAWFYLGQCAIEAGHCDLAERAMDQALGKRCGSDAWTSVWSTEEAELILARVVGMRGDAREAVDRLLVLAEQDPANDDTWFFLGCFLAVDDDPSAAIRAFSRAIEIDPSSGEAWVERARGFARLNRWSDALDDLRVASHLDMDLVVLTAVDPGFSALHHRTIFQDILGGAVAAERR